MENEKAYKAMHRALEDNKISRSSKSKEIRDIVGTVVKYLSSDQIQYRLKKAQEQLGSYLGELLRCF